MLPEYILRRSINFRFHINKQTNKTGTDTLELSLIFAGFNNRIISSLFLCCISSLSISNITNTLLRRKHFNIYRIESNDDDYLFDDDETSNSKFFF